MARKAKKKSAARAKSRPAKAKGKLKAKATRRASSKPRSSSGGQSDYIYLDQAQNAPPVVRVVKTAGLSKIKSRFGLADAAAFDEPSTEHGTIRREQRRIGNRDPVDDLGAKAVYMNAAGQVEARQG